jgi:hypothetical protein
MRDNPLPKIPSTDRTQLDPVECPHCGNVTMPNLLADGSYICSCPSERALPPMDGSPIEMPPPVDDSSFVSPTHGGPGSLPEDRGQFGRDVQTDDFKPLRDPPGVAASKPKGTGKGLSPRQRDDR